MGHIAEKHYGVHTIKKITILGLLIWTLAALFFLYEFFLRTSLGTLAPMFIQKLHIGAAQLSFISAAYFLIYAIMQIPVGIVIDKWGIRRPLMFAVFTCAIGMYLFGHSTAFYSLVISRMLMGFGSSFAFVSLLMLAINWFPKKNLGVFFGATQVLGAIGPILAGKPLLMLLQWFDHNLPRVSDYIAGFGVILIAAVFFFLQDKPKTKLKAKLKIAKRDFAIRKKLAELFSNFQVVWIAIYAFTSYASISLLGALWGTYYLETLGFTENVAVTITSMLWIGLAVGSPMVGMVSDRIKRTRLLLWVCSAFGLILSSAIIFTPSNSRIIYSLLFFGLGFFGAGQTLSFVCLSDRVKPHLRATAMGFNNTAVMLGGTLIPPLVGIMVEWSDSLTTGPHATMYTHQDFVLALLVMPLLYCLGLWISCFKIKPKINTR
jgi:MFS family permease